MSDDAQPPRTAGPPIIFHDGDGPPQVLQAIAQVMGEVEELEKTGTNERYNYNYVEESTVAEHVRPLMAETGLVCVPDIRGLEDYTVPGRQSDNRITRLKLHFYFMSAEDGSALRITLYSEGQDPLDKAIYKALTAAEKYALMKTFIMGTGDDPERDIGASEPAAGGGSTGGGGYGGSQDDGPDACPECGGAMWDNREKKRKGEYKENAPDFACRDKDGCGHKIWDWKARKVRIRFDELQDALSFTEDDVAAYIRAAGIPPLRDWDTEHYARAVARLEKYGMDVFTKAREHLESDEATVCPDCGTMMAPDEKMCQECGWDRNGPPPAGEDGEDTPYTPNAWPKDMDPVKWKAQYGETDDALAEAATWIREERERRANGKEPREFPGMDAFTPPPADDGEDVEDDAGDGGREEPPHPADDADPELPF